MADLSEAIADAARTLPFDQAEALARAVEPHDVALAARRGGVTSAISTPGFAACAKRLIEAWNSGDALDGKTVATALRAAARAVERERAVENIEVVWTGPAPPGVPVRMTSSVIADVAGAAQSRLLMLSYAAYRVPAVVRALDAACDRGVEVDLVLESQRGSGGKLSFDAKAAFGEVADRVRLWEWPIEKRPELEKGHASLHAKAAVADDHTAFVTSANMTGFGIDENIELGLFVRGGPIPKRIERYVRGLMREGILAQTR